uniref:CCHC-type domain-containing protein n=1 Tax=Cannabis sativa TaxID=3483 RepID=A0A803NYQ1_CANSA
MIKLPNIRDEFWVDFRYERLPEFCFECGKLGHPFEQCVSFMERMDNGNDDDLPFGPWMKGSKLPSDSYDRYRTDFSKGNAWPLLTRLARKSITATLPGSSSRIQPQPRLLFARESSSTPILNHTRPLTNSSSSTPTLPTIPRNNTNSLQPSHTTYQTPAHTSPKLKGIMVDSNTSTSSPTPILSSVKDSQNYNIPPIFSPSVPVSSSPPDVTVLSHIYTPDLGNMSLNTYATYPPSTNTLQSSYVSNKNNTISNKGKQIFTPSPPTIHIPIHIDKENIAPNSVCKRQNDSLSLRKTLKRCRGLSSATPSPWSVEEGAESVVSSLAEDSTDCYDFSAEQSPHVLFLMETKLSQNSLSRLKQSLKFPNGLEAPRIGLKGGLMLLWHDNVDVTLLHYGSTYFDCYLSFDQQPVFHFIGFYGAPEVSNRPHSWLLLKTLADTAPLLPWLAISDFNEILSNDHKLGGSLRNDSQMEAFRQALDYCHLTDLPCFGDTFTWVKNRHTVNSLKERLDWCFVNHHWENTFTLPQLQHLDFFNSDHRAISATFSLPTSIAQPINQRSRFLFEKIWLSDPDSKAIISNVWSDSHPSVDLISSFKNNLDACANRLQQWHFRKYGNMKNSIKKAQQQVSALNNASATSWDHVAEIKKSESILDELLAHEEAYWQQRSRVEWLGLGDRNTKFFHAKASSRKANNKIKFLLDSAGARITSKDGMAAVIESYFAGIFQTSAMDVEALDATLLAIPQLITPAMNKLLLAPFTGSEVEDALRAMGPDKSPGSDGSVLPTRSLRQGCPLSPYLFLIVSEGFSRLLQYEEQLGNLNGFAITRRATPISHLFFADDSLLFCQANEHSCMAIKRVLYTYHRASGQLLNPDKSVMSFSPNTTLGMQLFFRRQLNMSICECHEAYLGLPAFSGRNKKELFSGVKEKIWRLMQKWREQLFLAGGKEVLLKAVIQSIPTYAMSYFWLPITFCHQLASMMSNFWWGSNENGSKIHWRNWNYMCKTKSNGGLGFRSFIHFNQALLAKQAWRILQNPNSLLSQLFKSRYHPHNSFLEAHHGHSPFLTWQGILWGRELLQSGLRWKIGEGRSVLCGSDPWIPGHSSFQPISYRGPANGVVANLITENREWDLPLLQSYFSVIDVDRIMTIPLSYFPTSDHLIWHHTNNGFFSVKSGYHKAASIEEASSPSVSATKSTWWQYFWSLNLPPKKPPRSGSFKLNVDATLNASQHIIGVGAIVRDVAGFVVAALSKPIVGNFASHEMEAKALFHSLTWLLQMQISIDYIETDALMVSNALNNPAAAFTAFDDLILDISSLLSFFPRVIVSHVKRGANMAAHGLAKYALELDEDCFWLESCPPPIYSCCCK